MKIISIFGDLLFRLNGIDNPDKLELIIKVKRFAPGMAFKFTIPHSRRANDRVIKLSSSVV